MECVSDEAKLERTQRWNSKKGEGYAVVKIGKSCCNAQLNQTLRQQDGVDREELVLDGHEENSISDTWLTPSSSPFSALYDAAGFAMRLSNRRAFADSRSRLASRCQR